jgi:hypothetical protein
MSKIAAPPSSEQSQIGTGGNMGLGLIFFDAAV